MTEQITNAGVLIIVVVLIAILMAALGDEQK